MRTSVGTGVVIRRFVIRAQFNAELTVSGPINVGESTTLAVTIQNISNRRIHDVRLEVVELPFGVQGSSPTGSIDWLDAGRSISMPLNLVASSPFEVDAITLRVTSRDGGTDLIHAGIAAINR
jgi:hypothetical protein